MEYVVIDTESCTGKSDDGSLCSIGYALADENFNITEKNDIIINPLPKRFAVGDKKNLKRTGVMFAYPIERFRAAPDFKSLYPEIKRLFSGRKVLGFAMANDVKYLNDACDKFGLPRIEYEYMDVQFLYKLAFPDTNSVGLKTLADKYGVTYVEHRSDEDAAVSLTVLVEFLKEIGKQYTAFLAEYEVVYGKNQAQGHHAPYSVVEFRGEKGLKISKRLQNLVFADYLHNLPTKRGKEVYSFAYELEKISVDELRTIIDAIYRRGDSFTRDADLCTVYVKGKNESTDLRLSQIKSSSKRLKKIIDLHELTSFLKISKTNVYDDSEFLSLTSSKLIP